MPRFAEYVRRFMARTELAPKEPEPLTTEQVCEIIEQSRGVINELLLQHKDKNRN